MYDSIIDYRMHCLRQKGLWAVNYYVNDIPAVCASRQLSFRFHQAKWYHLCISFRRLVQYSRIVLVICGRDFVTPMQFFKIGVIGGARCGASPSWKIHKSNLCKGRIACAIQMKFAHELLQSQRFIHMAAATPNARCVRLFYGFEWIYTLHLYYLVNSMDFHWKFSSRMSPRKWICTILYNSMDGICMQLNHMHYGGVSRTINAHVWQIRMSSMHTDTQQQSYAHTHYFCVFCMFCIYIISIYSMWAYVICFHCQCTLISCDLANNFVHAIIQCVHFFFFFFHYLNLMLFIIATNRKVRIIHFISMENIFISHIYSTADVDFLFLFFVTFDVRT